MFALLFAGLSAFAATDSVAVFQRPEKIVVQINESGANSRLQKFLSAWTAGADLLWESLAKDIHINCGRNASAATCVIRLIPSQNVAVEDTVAQTEYRFEGAPAPQDSEASFESSRGQKFSMAVTGGVLKIKADSRRTAKFP